MNNINFKAFGQRTKKSIHIIFDVCYFDELMTCLELATNCFGILVKKKKKVNVVYARTNCGFTLLFKKFL